MVSPGLESSKLSGIDEEQQCCMVRSVEHHLDGSLLDSNGNSTVELSHGAVQRQSFVSMDSPSNRARHSVSMCGMTSSSASDSGCMIESGSSTATTDEDYKAVLSIDDVSCINNNNNIISTGPEDKPPSVFTKAPGKLLFP
ncbi:unnamed protein product [Gongylonema pulchrum]|uniref:Uncharacterized protein n=1 Tax=Gongylonema pulchrum TaxID=637853 RepID=A0A3P7M5Q6_9BILA|nr:unnamed protein product [Gongylonema pulchrum]